MILQENEVAFLAYEEYNFLEEKTESYMAHLHFWSGSDMLKRQSLAFQGKDWFLPVVCLSWQLSVTFGILLTIVYKSIS